VILKIFSLLDSAQNLLKLIITYPTTF